MSVSLSEKEFGEHVGTKFRAKFEQQQIDLELVEVKGYLSRENEQAGMERFSVFFVGPVNELLPQQTYRLEHDRMGAFDLFLVPVAGDEQSYRYEAVINYFK